MRPHLPDIAGQRFDVVVAGGGINGAGIAAEAARNGYRTLLVEREDFGGGTTSRSTRLIHGGLRYLEHGEVRLVYESLGDREALLREKPHLVRPLRLLLPVYAGDARPGWKVRAGLALYDALSLRKSMPRHHALPEEALDAYEPGLSRDGLRAAYTFYDAQVEFPERLTVESALDLTEAGGVALNHTSLAQIETDAGALRAVRLRDELTGGEAEIATRVVVNATGPWADETLAESDAQARDGRLIGGTKGSHLVADWPEGPRHAIFAAARSDGRPFFILPWYRYTLVGTTDLRYDGRPSDARCTLAELRYLLEEATRLFPSAPLTPDRVLYTYSGVRPLPYTPSRDESAITRSHFVIDHRARSEPAGLLSIVGGKLTTYRSLARATLREIRALTPASAPRIEQHQRRGTSAKSAEHLSLYGARAEAVRTLERDDPSLAAQVCAHNPETLAQVAYAVEREFAATAGDALLRRLPAGWSRCHAVDGLDAILAVMGERLGWDGARRQSERQAYLRELYETLVPVEAIAVSD